MLRTSPSISFLRLVLPVCFFALQLSTTLNPCSGEEIITAEEPSGEDTEVDNIFFKDGWYTSYDYNSYDSYDYYDNDDEGELIAETIGGLISLIVFGIVIYCVCCSDTPVEETKTWFQTEIESARNKVETDIAKEPYNSKNIPPSNCTYKGSYRVGEPGVDEIIHVRKTTLNFSKMTDFTLNNDVESYVSRTNTNGWKITGNGNDNGKPFTITEGKLCAATGEAYWIENSQGREIINKGKFQTPNFESFSGSWHARDGESKTYESFKKALPPVRRRRSPQGSSTSSCSRSRSRGGRVVRPNRRAIGDLPTQKGSPNRTSRVPPSPKHRRQHNKGNTDTTTKQLNHAKVTVRRDSSQGPPPRSHGRVARSEQQASSGDIPTYVANLQSPPATYGEA